MKNTKKYFFQSVEEARPVRASDVGEKIEQKKWSVTSVLYKCRINQTITPNFNWKLEN